MSHVFPFPLELRKSNYFTSGVQIQDNGHTVARENLLFYWQENTVHALDSTLQSTNVYGLANRRIISINLTYQVLNNWKPNPKGEHFHTKSMSDHEGVLEYLFS